MKTLKLVFNNVTSFAQSLQFVEDKLSYVSVTDRNTKVWSR